MFPQKFQRTIKKRIFGNNAGEIKQIHRNSDVRVYIFSRHQIIRPEDMEVLCDMYSVHCTPGQRRISFSGPPKTSSNILYIIATMFFLIYHFIAQDECSTGSNNYLRSTNLFRSLSSKITAPPTHPPLFRSE